MAVFKSITRRTRRIGRFVALAGLIATTGCAQSDKSESSATGAVEQQEARAPSGGEAEAPKEMLAMDEAPAAAAAEPAPLRDRMKRKPDAPTATATSNTEDYTDYGVNPWTKTAEDALSTFAVDVDTASFAIARRKIMEGQRPPAASVRVEEFVNYFSYDYAQPEGALPFAVDIEGAPAPHDSSRHILRVGIQGKSIEQVQRKPVHLTFLVDVSGSMSSADKLGLAKKALHMVTDQLQEGDTVSLVTYAGNTRVVLQPTGMKARAQIHAAIEDLNSGGGTAMQSGMELAYEQARAMLEPGHESRVIVLSDGDANIGKTSHDDILAAVAEHVEAGVTLSSVGFGMGNYKDTAMEQLANKGNGNYAYIDSEIQAKRTFIEELGGTLQVIAKDVKLQVAFNPEVVSRYRLIGYENRDIADKDFRDDAVDAGEIGAGHQVTALYEVELTDAEGPIGQVHVRHKAPEGSVATEHTVPMRRDALKADFGAASDDLRFAVAVASFAEILRGSPERGQRGLEQVLEMARAAADQDVDRQDFIQLVERAKTLPEDG